MRHAWILEVLTDLRTYAEGNDLPLIAAAADRTIDVARAEITAVNDADRTLPPE